MREDRNKIVLYWNFYPLLFCVYTVWICIIHVRDKVPCICDFLCSEQTSICLAFSIWFGEFGCLLRFTNCILVVVGLDFVFNFLGCTFLWSILRLLFWCICELGFTYITSVVKNYYSIDFIWFRAKKKHLFQTTLIGIKKE